MNLRNKRKHSILCPLQKLALILHFTDFQHLQRRNRLMGLTLHSIDIQYFIFSFLFYGVWQRAHIKMAAFGLALSDFLRERIKLQNHFYTALKQAKLIIISRLDDFLDGEFTLVLTKNDPVPDYYTQYFQGNLENLQLQGLRKSTI